MKVLLTIVLSAACLAARADDLREYRKQTRELIMAGKYAEALGRLEQYEAVGGEKSPVYLSFVLADWKRLGEVYPPALTSMMESRQRVIKELLETGGSFELFQEAAALNRVLDLRSQTVDLFAEIDRLHPDKAKRCWFAARDDVIRAKRFDLATKYQGDPQVAFTRAKRQYEMSNLRNAEQKENPRLTAAFQQMFARDIERILVVAWANGQQDTARKIHAQAIEVLDHPGIRAALPESPEPSNADADAEENE